MTEKFHYQCNDCGKEYTVENVMYLCPACQKTNTADLPPKGVLKTVYDFVEISKITAPKNLFKHLQRENFLSLLPIKNIKSLPKLRIGKTPLYKFNQIDSSELGFELYLKDDSQNPTFSFKDRASALVSAWAKENGINTIIAASTGNAGSSLAGICASQMQRSVIFVPAAAPLAKLTQIVMYGATIIPVNGTYDQAFDLSVKASEMFGFYNRNTAYNPLTIEGKKTVSFELFGDLKQHIPDRIFVPVGDGVIISGVYKGFEDLLNLGIIEKMPVIVAVQAEGSCNLINNIGKEVFRVTASDTLADSISVDIPRNYFMAVNYLQQYQGEYITVSDAEILQASVKLSRSTGIFAEPAAVAAFAGMLKYKSKALIPDNSKNVVLLTGSGLKDLKFVQPVIKLPAPIQPDTSELEKLFTTKKP
ncbi:MAG: threonine synthase [Bacteroidales bacterium]